MLGNQRGSATAIGVAFMFFMGIIISGLALMTSTNVGLMTQNKSGLEAEYVAEAGAIRAKVNILKSNTDWSWLGSNNPRPVATDASKNYAVTINPTIANGNAAASGQTYTITSVGTAGGHTKTVTITVAVPPSSNHVIWTPPQSTDPNYANYQNTIKYAALANGKITVYTGDNITNSTNGVPYTIATTGTASSNNNPNNLYVNSGVTNVYLNLLATTNSIFNSAKYAPFISPTLANNYWMSTPIANGDYLVNGGLSFNDTSVTTPNQTDWVLIYVTGGDVNINCPLIGNFAIISENNINLNCSGSKGNLQLYAKGNIQLNGSINQSYPSGKAVIMAAGDLKIEPGTYNNVFLYGSSVSQVSGAIIVGTVYSNGALELDNPVTITYNNTVMPAFP